MKLEAVSLYWLPKERWFTWKDKENGENYAYLCRDCAQQFLEAQWLADDEYYVCDICDEYEYSAEDWDIKDDGEIIASCSMSKESYNGH